MRNFGYNYSGQQKVELVNFCVSGFGLIERPRIMKLESRDAAATSRKGVRSVYFDGAWHDTPIYDRSALAPDARMLGPAIIEEFGSTTVVFPRQELAVDPHGTLVIRVTQTSAQTPSADLR
jgi:N-methylhydantoinase A